MYKKLLIIFKKAEGNMYLSKYIYIYIERESERYINIPLVELNVLSEKKT